MLLLVGIVTASLYRLDAISGLHALFIVAL